MVVFSDLDRSIIYSKKFLQDNIDLFEIELYKNENISYISKNTVEKIKDIKKNCYFIPTTTRTIDQFNRIDFKRYGIDFKYAITANGGNILVDGKIDRGYESYIEKKLKESANIDEVVAAFKIYKNIDGINNLKIAQNLFFYIVVEERLFDIKKIDEFKDFINNLKWDMYVSGRKIYFLPRAIKKSTAIKYICENLGYEETFAIGDSTMDIDMLEFCKNSYVLKHGDILNHINNSSFTISEDYGFLGTEKILDDVIKIQNKFK